MILIRLLLLLYFTDALDLYFERNTYEIFVSESTEIYSRISLIRAISSSSLSIEYELHGDTHKTFYLNSITGELILLNRLDYETIPIYKLTIEARSSSSLITPCFSELIIHILNTNDNPPDMNLVIYPSVFYEPNMIKYDRNVSSTPFATIHIKDPDLSTENLTFSINDTQHFQIQFIRRSRNSLTYLLSTKNNSQFIDQDEFDLALNSCDNDQPLLCTNRTYRFQFKSKEYLCNLSFIQKKYIIDIQENLLNRTLLIPKITNKFCENMVYSIDDTENFYMDSSTGDLFPSKSFNRTERSIYKLHLVINQDWRIKIIVRILDQYGRIPFLMNKYLLIHRNQFFYANLFNSTSCRRQLIIENYFQLLANCTIIPIIQPPKGQYLFHIELSQRANYHDTFLLELQEEQARIFKQSRWTIIVPIIVGVLVFVGAMIGLIVVIKQNDYQLCQKDQRASPLSIDDESHYQKYDALSAASKLKVHDDHEISSSPTSTAIYLVGKPSPPLSSLTPQRDDEGYSGSSDVSDHHLQFETTIISANELLEQYRVHDFYHRRAVAPLYDVPRRHSTRINTPRISPDASLV